MSLKDSLQHEKARGTRKGPDCRLCVAMRSMDAKDLQALTEALDDQAMSGAAIGRALRAEGHDISPVIVLRHRKGECRP